MAKRLISTERGASAGSGVGYIQKYETLWKFEDPEEALQRTEGKALWNDSNGCKNLCRAIIVSALLDVVITVDQGVGCPRKSMRDKDLRDVYEWFFSHRKHEPFCFYYCAQAVTSDAERADSLVSRVRALIKRKVPCPL
jgi:hypothetical protein